MPNYIIGSTIFEKCSKSIFFFFVTLPMCAQHVRLGPPRFVPAVENDLTIFRV